MSARKSKFYVVTITAYNQETGSVTAQRLVEAKNEAKVLQHLQADSTITIAEAEPQELVALGHAGVRIEQTEVNEVQL